MPRAQSTKAKDEHLIFVKNVPADLAIVAIPRLFAQYDPVRIKNVYPNSDITTIVVGFETHEEAIHAQQETDGMRLEHVVLRVEMYSKHRSVRFLRETRTSNRPLGAVEANYEEVRDEQEQEQEYVLPFGQSQGDTPGTTTWARIVSNKNNGTGMTPLPAPAVDAATRRPTPTSETQISTPVFEVAVPRFDTVTNTKTASSDVASADYIEPHSPHTSSIEIAGYEGDVEDNQKARKRQPTKEKVDVPARTGIFAPWHSVNTSWNIAQRHCRDCFFCKLHDADWKHG